VNIFAKDVEKLLTVEFKGVCMSNVNNVQEL